MPFRFLDQETGEGRVCWWVPGGEGNEVRQGQGGFISAVGMPGKKESQFTMRSLDGHRELTLSWMMALRSYWVRISLHQVRRSLSSPCSLVLWPSLGKNDANHVELPRFPVSFGYVEEHTEH